MAPLTTSPFFWIPVQYSPAKRTREPEGIVSAEVEESKVEESLSTSSHCMSNELLFRALVPARAPSQPELASGSGVPSGHWSIVLAAVVIWPLMLFE